MASTPIVLYGVFIHEAIASGDLAEMKKVVKLANELPSADKEHGAALESLRIEIAKLEKQELGER